MGNALFIVFLYLLAAGVGYVVGGAALFVVALPALLFADPASVWQVTSNIGALVGGVIMLVATWEMW